MLNCGMGARRKPGKGEATGFLEGKLLIAMPGMSDPRFEKTVILICAHSQDGAMGLILNKPVDGLGFRELVEHMNLPATSGVQDLPVLYGGPMQTGRGFVLHSNDYDGHDSTMPVTEDVSLTATLDILKAMAQGEGPEQAVFALGYAGWGPGQVEREIGENGWVHCDADSALVFGQDMQSKWSGALGKLGIDLLSLSSHAGRA
jgi:putative transcriptional regulator